MSVENDKASQDNDLLGLSQYDADIDAKVDEQFAALAKKEEEVEDEPSEENPEAEAKAEEAEISPELKELKAQVEALSKQYKDTRDYATQKNQTALQRTKIVAHLVTKLQAEGKTHEEIAEMAGIKPDEVKTILNGDEFNFAQASDPLTFKIKQFDDQYAQAEKLGLLKSLIGKDEDPKAYLEDFRTMFVADQALQEEFINSEAPLSFVFGDKGREIVATARATRDYGKTPAAIISAQGKRIAELEALVAAKEGKEPTTGDSNNSTSKKSRLDLTSSKSSAPASTTKAEGGELFDWR